MTTQELVKPNIDDLRQLLSANPSLDAAALYGSAARGDFEAHSDIDVLLLCSSRKSKVFVEVKELLCGLFERLSLTVYSRRELRFLESVGSLFLLHLSKEAVVLFDRSDFLTRLLANFEPKSSYRRDFEASLRLLDPVRIVVQGAPNNVHRSSYIYSLFRVFGVYLLAERGVYEFSKTRMSRLLVDAFPTQRGNIALLAALRPLN
jgi:predicted nucleotidyltransferase